MRKRHYIAGSLLSSLLLITIACVTPPATNMALDLETREASVPAGVLSADVVLGAFVAAVDDDLYIAVTVREDAADGTQTFAVYLCDGVETSLWLTGTVRDGQGSLQSGDTRVEIVGVGGGMHGTVALEGRQPVAFTAMRINGVTGFYQADAQIEGTRYLGRWIVLPDRSQRGAIVLLHEDDEQQDITYFFQR